MVEGQIALAARGYLPQTWDALASSTFYGEGLLDSKQAFIKFMLFGTVVNTQLEATTYNPIVTEYAGKALAITLIPAGADYYGSKLVTMTATGTNESRTYPDRIAMLWHTHARLLQEMQEMLPYVQQYIPNTNLKRLHSVPRSSGRGKIYLAPDPGQFWPQGKYWGYSATTWNRLPWSDGGYGI